MRFCRTGITALIVAATLTGGCNAGEKVDAAEHAPTSTRDLESPNLGDNLLLVARSASGTIATSDSGTTTVTLHDTDTITWFSDRPQHDAGLSSAREALEAFGWKKNGDGLGEPPNAAIVAAEYGDATPVVQVLSASLSDGNVAFTVRFVGAPPAAVNSDLTDIELFIDDSEPRLSGVVVGGIFGDNQPGWVEGGDGYRYTIISTRSNYSPRVGDRVMFTPDAGFLQAYATQVSPN